jgi:hypothetical protein
MRSIIALAMAACVAAPAMASAQPYPYPPSSYGYHHHDEWRDSQRMAQMRHHQIWCRYHPASRACR